MAKPRLFSLMLMPQCLQELKELARLESVARKEDVSVSMLIREAIRDSLGVCEHDTKS